MCHEQKQGTDASVTFKYDYLSPFLCKQYTNWAKCLPVTKSVSTMEMTIIVYCNPPDMNCRFNASKCDLCPKHFFKSMQQPQNMWFYKQQFLPSMDIYQCKPKYQHTHTHTHTYIYI